MTVEAEAGAMHPPFSQGPLATQELDEVGRALPWSLQRKPGLPHLDFGLPASRTERGQSISVLSHQVCGPLSQQLQKANTSDPPPLLSGFPGYHLAHLRALNAISGLTSATFLPSAQPLSPELHTQV